MPGQILHSPDSANMLINTSLTGWPEEIWTPASQPQGEGLSLFYSTLSSSPRDYLRLRKCMLLGMFCADLHLL